MTLTLCRVSPTIAGKKTQEEEEEGNVETSYGYVGLGTRSARRRSELCVLEAAGKRRQGIEVKGLRKLSIHVHSLRYPQSASLESLHHRWIRPLCVNL